jgi:hypothetical protein
MACALGGQGEPQADIDEQPTGSAREGRGEAVLALVSSDASGCWGAVLKLGDTVSDYLIKEQAVLVHDLAFLQGILPQD